MDKSNTGLKFIIDIRARNKRVIEALKCELNIDLICMIFSGIDPSRSASTAIDELAPPKSGASILSAITYGFEGYPLTSDKFKLRVANAKTLKNTWTEPRENEIGRSKEDINIEDFLEFCAIESFKSVWIDIISEYVYRDREPQNFLKCEELPNIQAKTLNWFFDKEHNGKKRTRELDGAIDKAIEMCNTPYPRPMEIFRNMGLLVRLQEFPELKGYDSKKREIEWRDFSEVKRTFTLQALRSRLSHRKKNLSES